MFLNNVFVVLLVACSLFLVSNSLMLDCQYSVITPWNITDVYTCTARVIFIGDARYITEVSHNHLDGRNNSHVRGLILIDQTLGFTPKNISAFFPNLETMIMSNIRSDEITPENLRGLNNLKEFGFAGNELRIIENDLFIENPLLARISFSDNPIRHIAHSVFDQLPYLRALWLTGNIRVSCIDGYGYDDDIDYFLFRLTVSCPPTFEMTESKIVSGSALNSLIERQITSRLDPIIAMLIEIEANQINLEERVRALESTGIARNVFT